MKNKVRLTLQFIILGLLGYVAIRPALDNSYSADFEAYCPFGGISSFFSKLNLGTMSCNMSEVQVFLGLGLIVTVILAGKLFCSHLCPIGTVTEWLGRIGNKFRLRKEMPKVLDRAFRSLKYILLFITIYYTMTASELFCKEFDPYFASVNLFGNPDNVLYYAIPAFIIVILGSVFFRLFWCKYLCPLGAMSNIFMNAIGAGSVILLFIILNAAGAELSLVWLLGGLVFAGLLNELGFMKSSLNPMPKITRDEFKCTSCGLCDKKCPQGIKISEMEKVDHIDCTLCTDCVYSCSKNALTVNRKKNLKYLAPAATVILVLLSLGASSEFEFATLSEKWGNYASLTNVEVYEQSGLKNVKCFGSASSLKGKLETVDGIVGLDAFARSHTVKIYYNPAVISEKKVKASLFTSTKMEVRKIKDPSLQSLTVWEVGIFRLFDLIDFNNLFYALRGDEGVYGFETHYGEPVLVKIYFDPAKTNPARMKEEIEQEKVMAKKPTGEVEVELDFSAADIGKVTGTVTPAEYNKVIFKDYDRMFNHYTDYKPEELSAFIFPMPQAGVPIFRRQFGALTSHLSADDGIVRFSTRYFDGPSGIIYFNPKTTSIEKIKAALVEDNLTIFLNDTETKDIKNPFNKLNLNGKIVSAAELSIDEELETL